MSTARAEAAVGVTSAGTASYCLKRSLKLSTVCLRFRYGQTGLVITWSLDYVNEEGAPFDSGFDDAGPFSVTPEADGVALDAALREFGPAAFEDFIPRLRSLAADLDAAHTAGFIHGRLHPSKVFVTGDATYLLGARVQSLDPSTALGTGDTRRWPIQPPYTAPEVMQGAPPAPMSDQFSLAAIAYEWMFGRPI